MGNLRLLWVNVPVILLLEFLVSPGLAWTNPSDVAALQDLYKALNCPAQLTRWNLSGGDPCEESWKGISCYATFVIFMDLSYNFLTGDLPSSFANLTNLTGLIGGNKFHPGASYLPWNFPSGTISNDRNTTSLSDTLTNVVDYNPLRKVGHKQRRFGPGEITCTVAGVALITIGLAVIAAISINKYVVHKRERVQSNGTPKTSSSSDSNYAFRSEHTQVSPVVSSFMPLPTPPNAQMVFQSATENTNKRSSFSTRRIPVTAKKFTVAELQSVTRSFGEVNFLGEGSLGSVYKAQLPDGQVEKNHDTTKA
ncbi:hypothetical protein Syun_002193 [Stephania yunnanensis]|uniref:Leucine-rich repeat-containing N-terminal plant-type domain-containing protein n=1 Tax=Stephania yunnanensis TaxID=152371 RepID=A0AAP0LF20_9MAGN